MSRKVSKKEEAMGLTSEQFHRLYPERRFKSEKQRKRYEQNLKDIHASPFLKNLGWKGKEEEIAYQLSTKEGRKDVQKNLEKVFKKLKKVT